MADVKADITPDFSPDAEGAGSGLLDFDKLSDNTPSGRAASNLSNAESAAAGSKPNNSEDSVNGTRKGENAPSEGFKNSVSGKSTPSIPLTKAGMAKAAFKKYGPVGGILVLLLGVGGAMLGAQSLMPFSLLEQFRETFDSLTTMTNRRSGVFLKLALRNGKGIAAELDDDLARKFYGNGESTYQLTTKQKNTLRNQGIFPVENYNGSGYNALLYDDGGSGLRVVVSDDWVDDLGIDSSLEFNGKKVKGDQIKFQTFLDTDVEFRNSYNKGSRQWRSGFGSWFDSITARFLAANNVTRNRFKNFRDKMNQEGTSSRRTAIDLMEEKKKTLKTDTEDQGPAIIEEKIVYEKDADGKDTDIPVKNDDGSIKKEKITTNVEYDPETRSYKYEDGTEVDWFNEKKIDFSKQRKTVPVEKSMSKMEAKEFLVNAKKSVTSRVTGATSAVVNGTCAVLSLVGTVSLVIAAQESLQIIQLVTGYFEAIDKVKAGKGVDSPIHDLANGLVTPMATTREVVTSSMDDIEALETESEVIKGHESTTAMQSAGISSLYSNSSISPTDPGVENFTPGSKIRDIVKNISVGITSFTGCAIAKFAASLVDMTMDAVVLIACLFTAGMACIAQAAGEIGVSGATQIAIAGAVQIAMVTIAPLFIKALTRDLISDLAGEDLGNALMSGANMYLGNNHRSGGGSLASPEKYVAFKAEQAQVIAEEAEFQRRNRDPFDVTSKYTFLGSIVDKLTALSTISSGPMNILNSFSSLVSKSISDMLPSASAVEIAETMPNPETYSEYCPDLASIGAIGDAYCNPYIITDMDTAGGGDFAPGEVVERIREENLTDEGEIIEDSKLAKYIDYCVDRSSAFGVADQNIASAVSEGSLTVSTSSSAVNTVANGAIGAIPVIGDVSSYLENKKVLQNIGWVTGEVCVAGNTSRSTYPEYDDEELADYGYKMGEHVEKPNQIDEDGDPTYTTVGAYNLDWEETRDYQRFIEDQRLAESIYDDYESAVTAYLEKRDEKNPVDNSYEAILARKSGLTKDTVIAMIDYMKYENYIANYEPTPRYRFNQSNPGQRIYIENTEQEGVIANILNPFQYSDIRNRYFTAA